MPAETSEFSISQAPRDNFSRGLLQYDFTELRADFPKTGAFIRGKVRDILCLRGEKDANRIMVTTDRLSAYDRLICTIPGKGQVLNMLSAWWFENTRDIVANHVIAIPHPNVLVAKEAKATLPVEVVLRRYMAKSATSTSVYNNYVDKGRREIYGIRFPEGLRANEEFPMGTILTPTTKAESGHDEELTDDQAAEIVDKKLGDGVWKKTKIAAHQLFSRGRQHCFENGLMLVDTKYEFGLDKDGNLMVIDEMHTPDSSRFWFTGSYQERFEAGQNPENLDKELVRRWLAEHGFTGEGMVPTVDPEVIDRVSDAYTVPYEMITGHGLPTENASIDQIMTTSPAISAIYVTALPFEKGPES